MQTITKEMFQYLVEHIKDVHNKKISIANAFALDYSAFITVLEFVNSYIRTIENYLEAAKIGSGQHELPFVILDCTVFVTSHKDGKTYRYRIIPPTNKTPSENIDDLISIDCISPLGKALLFKSVEDKVESVGLTGKIQKIDFINEEASNI